MSIKCFFLVSDVICSCSFRANDTFRIALVSTLTLESTISFTAIYQAFSLLTLLIGCLELIFFKMKL